MPLRGCCPPLARPRTHLGGEIIGFNEKTGQFVQAAAGAPAARVGPYPFYASAGVGSVGTNLMWGGIALLAVVSLAFFAKEFQESL